MKEFLRPGRYIDSAHPAVARFSAENAPGSTERERAVSLYYAVRDKVRYNPFLDFSNAEVFKASSVLAADQGFCVGKAALLADRKSTRLNSSHTVISYAVFCLK